MTAPGRRASAGTVPADLPALDAAGPAQRRASHAVLLLVCPPARNKGTGFIVEGGLVLTTHHVVDGVAADDIVGVDWRGRHVAFDRLVADRERDLAALRPSRRLPGGLLLTGDETVEPGVLVTTWGYPLGYFGPAPLLSVGYLAGHLAVPTRRGVVRQLVVNGAFNPGNSGGPLFRAGDDRVLGVVASKHAPLPPFVASALDALAANPRGHAYTARDSRGTRRDFVESQLVAEIFRHFRDLSQVMIGQAVAACEVRRFLRNARRRLAGESARGAEIRRGRP